MTKQEAPRAQDGGGKSPPMVAHGLTHTGRRPRNEDCHLIREDLGLAIVADGFGGAAGGNLAARLAVDEIADCFGVQATLPSFEAYELADGLTVAMVRFAIEHAHMRIRYEAQRAGPPAMSAAVAVLVVAGPRVVIGNAGNVRVYRFRADALELLTNDGPAGARLGGPPGAQRGVAPSICTDTWKPGDRYLLCSAGLHEVLSAEQIRCTLAARVTLAESATALVGRALHAGAAGNLTAVVVAPAHRPVAKGMIAAGQCEASSS